MLIKLLNIVLWLDSCSYLILFFFFCLFVVITGPNRSGVVGARSRIEVIAESSRQKIPFTHFLCFPLYNSDLERKMDEFKVKVLKDCFEVIIF